MRLAPLTLAMLDAEQTGLYDAIVGVGRRPGAVVDDRDVVQGPFTAMMYHPVVGHPLQDLGSALRFRGRLPHRARELVILTVAAGWRSEFEWWAHDRLGRRHGLTGEEIAAVRDGGQLALDDMEEAAALAAARALVARGDLDDAEYPAAVEALGVQGVMEVSALVGYYGILALQMRVFRVGLPEGAAPVFDDEG